MSTYFTAGEYRYGKCPHCQSPANTMVLNKDGYYTCMACGKIGTIKRFQNDEEETPVDKNLMRLNLEASDIFMDSLLQPVGAGALAYLKERGITEETIRSFRLGYVSNGKYLETELIKRGHSQKQLVESGLFKENDNGSIWMPYVGRIMFSICNAKGEVIGFSGRVKDDSEPKYKNTPETSVFHKRDNLYGFDRALRSGNNHIILCEGQMDVISMHQAGFHNAVASLGTALTDSQAKLLRSFTDRVIILYDTDEAGVKATKRAISVLKEAGIKAYVSNSFPCKDPDEFIQKNGAEELKKRLRHPDSALEYAVSNAKKEDGDVDYDGVCELLLKDFNLNKALKAIKRIS